MSREVWNGWKTGWLCQYRHDAQHQYPSSWKPNIIGAITVITAPETQEEVRSQIEGASLQVLEQLIQILKKWGERRDLGRKPHTSLVAGNIKVGTDSLSPSIHGFLGYDLWNPPKISTFHGEKATEWGLFWNSGYFRLGQFKYCIWNQILREVFIKSLKGTAADIVRYMGPQVEVIGVISKLETVCGIIVSFDVWMQLFHKISQDLNGKIPAYTTRTEGALNQWDWNTQTDQTGQL